MKKQHTILILCLLASCFWAAAQTEIPRGGKVIELGPGVNLGEYILKNTTDESASDVTFTIWHPDPDVEVPSITKLDVTSYNNDRVDDNYDGSLQDGESDVNNNPASVNCRNIFGTSLSKSKSVNAKFELNGITPPGTKLTIRFSKERDNIHYDLLATLPAGVPGMTASAEIPVGTKNGSISIVNESPNYLSMIIIPTSELYFETFELEAPYDNSQVWPGTGDMTVFFDPPIPPFDRAVANFELPEPLLFAYFMTVVTLEAYAHACGLELESAFTGECNQLNDFILTLAARFNPDIRYCREYTFTNKLDISVSDLHVGFRGTGGDLTTTLVDSPPGCGVPSIPSNDYDITNKMEIVWPTACIDPGEHVRVKVCTQNGPIEPFSAYWTLNDDPVGDLDEGSIGEGPESGMPSEGMGVYINDAFKGILPLRGGTASGDFVLPSDGQNIDIKLVLLRELFCELGMANVATAPACMNPVFELDCSLFELDPNSIPLEMYPVQQVMAGQRQTLENFSNPIEDIRIIPPTMINSDEAYQCGIDYMAIAPTLIPPFTTVGLEFYRPGPYFVQTTYADGTLDQIIYEVDTRSSTSYDEESICYNGPFKEIPCGEPDIAVVSDNLGWEHSWGESGAIATDLDSAAMLICKAFEAKGGKVSVVINGHGGPGYTRVGTERLNASTIEAFAEQIKDKVSSLVIMSCSAASGETGEAYICKLEQELEVEVTGYTGTVSDILGPPAKWFTAGDAYSWEDESVGTLEGSRLAPELEVGLSPNPTQNQINVSLNVDQASILQVQLLDSNGKVLQQETWQVGSGEQASALYLGQYPAGLYFLKVQDGATIVMEKIIRF